MRYPCLRLDSTYLPRPFINCDHSIRLCIFIVVVIVVVVVLLLLLLLLLLQVLCILWNKTDPMEVEDMMDSIVSMSLAHKVWFKEKLCDACFGIMPHRNIKLGTAS